ncbi:MarR family winged helix-turn-helix transcriptional regulator [Azohydromonas aeria]|uniref:MarR family winged helix-turn-helix transcriptional regulator n=1 Tax=Azohydromonas aeria TaxID=2590212 RepID=UPI0012FBA5A1|nr:MarR family transcriptional regulator [Azohydromonas aeria]
MPARTHAADVADAVVEQLDALLHMFHAEMHRAMREARLPLGSMELRALRHIADHPGCTAGDLARHSGRDKGQVTRLLQQLEKDGYLRRDPHPQDARAQCLQVTPAGAAVHARLRQERRALARALLSTLETQEQAQLAVLLQRLAGGASAESS